ncbi:MAG: polymer-forming cytoskeletal protein [Defluviitaleaceae bacterium]|nr:polymer-forming cytoskeletal protein [Defluviitaleaceae bacterium]
MFFKKVAEQALNAPNTVIGEGMSLEAVRMTGAESVRIDGIYKGNLELEGSLVLGDSGVIHGNVEASYFLVAGEITGNVKCHTQLHFASTAKITGDIEAQSLIVDEGSQVNGRYKVGQPKTPISTIEARGEKVKITQDAKLK